MDSGTGERNVVLNEDLGKQAPRDSSAPHSLESSSTRERGQRAALMAQEVPAEPVLGTPATVHTWTPQGLGQQLLLSGNTCITFVVKKTSPEGFIIMWILL